MLTAGHYRWAFDLGIHTPCRIIGSSVGNIGFEMSNDTGLGRVHVIGQARGYKSLMPPGWPVETKIIAPAPAADFRSIITPL